MKWCSSHSQVVHFAIALNATSSEVVVTNESSLGDMHLWIVSWLELLIYNILSLGLIWHVVTETVNGRERA